MFLLRGENMKQQPYVWLALSIVFGQVGLLISSAGASEVHFGEQLDPALCGPGVIETMDDVTARQRSAPPALRTHPDDDKFKYGEWSVPNIRGTTFPNSGKHNVVNKQGDTRMGIGFPEVVDVHGAYFAGQGGEGGWTTGIRVVGYRDDEEVARTDWFREIGEEPTWFEMDLCGVDRIVIHCEPVIQSAGWYGMDDLTYVPASSGPVVLDFEDVSYATMLSGSEYAGLIWEWGTGFELNKSIHPPQVPPDMEEEDAPADSDDMRSAPLYRAVRPTFEFEFQGAIRGDPGSWSYPPDTCGAVGPDHFVEAVNTAFVVYNRETGAQLYWTYLTSFLPGSGGDPRILFDQHSWRWIVIASNFDAPTPRIYLAISLTDDPLGSWYKTNFVVSSGSDAGKWSDYPTLGMDERGIYIASYMVGGSSTMTLFAIDKAPLIDSPPSLGTVTAFRSLPWEGAIQCAHTYGSTVGAYCASLAGSSWVRVRRVDPPLTSPTLVELALVQIPTASSPPDAVTTGSTIPLDTVGNRLMMAVYRDGSLWTTNTVKVGTRAASRWYEIDPEANELIQYGTVSHVDRNYFFPSLSVNRYGTVVLGFTGSGPTQYASAYYTGRRRTDPPGEMASPTRYEPGSSAYNVIDGYNRNRWGDYSYTTVDPVEELRFWTIQEYVDATDVWGTMVAVLDGGDCNDNDLRDKCDVDCGEPGGECDIPGCGTCPDCNDNQTPDECEDIIAACCFPDGSCCHLLTPGECSVTGVYYEDGLGCEDALDPPCTPAETWIESESALTGAFPGGTVTLEFTVKDVGDLTGYQIDIEIARISGEGTLYLDCSDCPGEECGANVDVSRQDYVFNGQTSYGFANCESNRIAAVSFDSVTIGSTPAYLGEYRLTVSGDTTTGTVFEVSVVNHSAVTFLRDSNQVPIRFQISPACTITVADPGDCLAPTIGEGGSRHLLVTPITPAMQALLVTGDPLNPDISCVSKYVQEDGMLGDDPVFATAATWGTVAVRGPEIIPSALQPGPVSTYYVEAQCGTSFSPPVAVDTWMWGDVCSPPNNRVDIDDILAVIHVFQSDYTWATLEQADLSPCTPNGIVDIDDILADIQAFQSKPYTDTGCDVPCS